MPGTASTGGATPTTEQGAALALLPLIATLIYYASPRELQQESLYQFLPQVCAYIAFFTWNRINDATSDRLGLTRSLLPQGLRLGTAIGLALGLINLLVILYCVPLLGGEYRFLADTPHAKIPFPLMVPWFIFIIATMVEVNFRGFLLGRLLALGLPASMAVPMSALLFAFDPFLVATFQQLHWIAVWDGLVWGSLWITFRNLYVTIIAHGVEVIVLYSVIRAMLM